MIKLYSSLKRLSILYYGSVWPNLQTRPFLNGLNFITENFHGKCYLQTSSNKFDKKPTSQAVETEKLSAQEVEEKKNEVLEQPTILLIEKHRKVGIVTLKDAQNIAKKRNLKLVKVDRPGRSSNQEVYQLLTKVQLQQEEMKSATNEDSTLSKGSKKEKNIVIGSKITDHDLGIKINSIKKWLMQNCIIRITLNNDEADTAERIFSELQKAVVEAGGRTTVKNKTSDGKSIKVIFQHNSKLSSSG